MKVNNIEKKKSVCQIVALKLNFVLFFATVLEGFYNVFYSLGVLSGSRRPLESSVRYNRTISWAVSLNEGKALYLVSKVQ